MRKILIVTGDAGESYESLYAVHRLREAEYEPVVAAPSRRRLHLVIHDFEPGWDTYVERQGYGLESDITFEDVKT
ncbi:MAG: DJ-1/PfpI family protein, partial [Terriglobia bacterium]